MSTKHFHFSRTQSLRVKPSESHERLRITTESFLPIPAPPATTVKLTAKSVLMQYRVKFNQRRENVIYNNIKK